MKVDLVFLVMGFVLLVVIIFEVFGVDKDVCGNGKVLIEGVSVYCINVDKVFVVGDM